MPDHPFRVRDLMPFADDDRNMSVLVGIGVLALIVFLISAALTEALIYRLPNADPDACECDCCTEETGQ